MLMIVEVSLYQELPRPNPPHQNKIKGHLQNEPPLPFCWAVVPLVSHQVQKQCLPCIEGFPKPCLLTHAA
uniref:Uncharacterized protein n=1 Tax=Rhizophora mucronata TaxID=61149 RepID=A0A2P2Q0N8_RHIMU